MKGEPTHIRLKTNTKVFVERFEGNVIVVKNLKDNVVGSYEGHEMGKFHKRYKPIKKRLRNS